MKKNMFRVLFTLGTIASCALMTSCVAVPNDNELNLGGKTVNYFGAGPTAENVTKPEKKPVVAPQETKTIMLVTDQKDLLRVVFAADGAGKDERTLSESLVQEVTGAISADDARVLSSGKGDISIVIAPKFNLIDKDGDYYRMNCEVAVTMKDGHSPRVFGAKTFKLVAPKRVLGKDKAIAQFTEPAQQQVSIWCRDQLKRIVNNELAVTVITVQLPTVSKGKARDAKKDAAAIKAIGDNLGHLPNLVTYEFVGQDNEAGTCQFRVAYLRSAYPSGITNEVSALVKSIVKY